MTRFAAAVVLVLTFAAPALASERPPTLAELETELICPTCHTTLDQSSSPIADRMRAFIRTRIAAGDTKSEIKSKLVAQFGPAVLASPPKKGLDLLVWLLPLAGVVVGAVVLAVLARRWSRGRADEARPPADPGSNGRPPLGPEVERRLDEELARFDS
jgi:cytochrome c-type biogenesis protein CcmH